MTHDEVARIARDARRAALEEAARAADELGYRCEGCDHLCRDPAKDLAQLKKAGHLSCCPERKMLPLGNAIRALVEPDEPRDH